MFPIPPALADLAFRVCAYAMIGASLYGLGRFHAMQAAERERNEQIITAWKEGDRHVASYFKKSQALADARTVADRLRSRVCKPRPVRDPERVDGAAGADAADRQPDDIDQLGGELNSCQRNRFKLEGLQAALKPQLASQRSWWEFWKD